MSSTCAVVLAAGKGSRMNSTTQNKVVSTVGNKPMVSYTVEHLYEAGIKSIVAVVGFASDSVKQVLGNKVEYVTQSKRLGTGHALKCALPKISGSCTTILSMYGDDSAFYPPQLFQQFIDYHQQSQADVTVLTIDKQDPKGLGRIVRNSQNQISAIVEEKNATAAQKKIKEINTGLFCFNKQFLQYSLPKIEKNPISKEYYITDLIEIAIAHSYKVAALKWPDSSVWFGVNTPQQLSNADQLMNQAIDS
jgi:bifunctional UDP-N-acetylglucosamine pyrophosphorylase/glucosamine-1-phosphate N-acetyltransferase